MAQMTLQQAIETGLEHHRAGRLRPAHEMYSQVLQFDPENIDAQHLLGVLAHQMGNHAVAADMIRKAIALNGEIAAMHFNLAEALRMQRETIQAAVALRRAIELDPNYMEAHNNLSLVLFEMGHYAEAEAEARRAMEIDPTAPSPLNNLSNALREMGRLEEAIEAALRALHLKSDFPQALNNLGICYARQNRPTEAIVSYKHAIKLKPDFAEAYSNLAAVLGRVGQYDAAVEAAEQAIRIRPDYSDAYNNLGGALKASGKLDQGVLCYEKAVSLRPGFAEAMNNLGLSLKELGRSEEAIKAIRRAIEIKPEFADAYYNLGITHKEQSKLDEAVEHFNKALSIEPNHLGAVSALAIVRMEQGDLDTSMDLMRRSLAIEKDWQIHSNYCLLSNYHPKLSGEEVLEVHKQWDRDYGTHKQPPAPHTNDRNPSRKIRIGYVSPDFKNHAVSHFIEPILGSHDKTAFEVFGYAHVAKPDVISHFLKSKTDQWREIFGKNDDQVEKMIREDQIDILVDLAGHTALNRLTLFSRKPAPVQVSMIGYPSTTGLAAMDYKIADHHSDPEGVDRLYTEKLYRLEGTFWCFRPLDDREPVGDLPAKRNGFVTFGSVNNFAKVSPEVLDLWARIVAAVPKSRIEFQHSALGSEVTRRRVIDAMAKHGVTEDRIEMAGWGGFEQYIDRLRGFDLALDPFPFNGGTTTCHQLFYGVPFITLTGERQVSRMGVSMLNALGMPELIANSTDDYFDKAVALARDVDRMARLRSVIRPTMIESPLCNAIQYTRQLEDGYRKMFATWCNS